MKILGLAATLIASLALALPASAEISIRDATAHDFTGQRTIAAMQSADRVAVHVQTTDPDFRRAIEAGVLYLEKRIEDDTGIDVQIGITHGTRGENVPLEETRVSVFVNGEPTDFGFWVERFYVSPEFMKIVAETTVQKVWGAYREFYPQRFGIASN